jgi:hypothetical protein
VVLVPPSFSLLTFLPPRRTLQLELKYLSELTGNPIYWQKAEKVSPSWSSSTS